MYFSYEPSFLFVDEDNEDGVEDEFVCECCDPKKKKKPVSSEDVSELEEEQEETDGLLSDSEEDADESPCRSRDSSPALGPPVADKAASKPLAPGWFGKGRRRRGKLK